MQSLRKFCNSRAAKNEVNNNNKENVPDKLRSNIKKVVESQPTI